MKRAGEWLLFLQAISGIMDTFVGLSLYHKRGKPVKLWGPNWYEETKQLMWEQDREFIERHNASVPKPKLTTVWEGDSLDILARESIEGLTKHQPKGKSRYGNY